jgi:hypothetical protein
MIVHTITFSLLLVLTSSLVYSSVFYNLPNTFSQIFEVDENDYFEFDETSSDEEMESDSREKESDDGFGEKSCVLVA